MATRARMNTLFIIRVKILMLFKWSCRSPTPSQNNFDYWALSGYCIWAHGLVLFLKHVFLVSILGATLKHSKILVSNQRKSPIIGFVPLSMWPYCEHFQLHKNLWTLKGFVNQLTQLTNTINIDCSLKYPNYNKGAKIIRFQSGCFLSLDVFTIMFTINQIFLFSFIFCT